MGEGGARYCGPWVGLRVGHMIFLSLRNEEGESKCFSPCFRRRMINPLHGQVSSGTVFDEKRNMDVWVEVWVASIAVPLRLKILWLPSRHSGPT